MGKRWSFKMTIEKDHPLKDLSKVQLLNKIDKTQTLLFNTRLVYMKKDTNKEFLVLDTLYGEFMNILKEGYKTTENTISYDDLCEQCKTYDDSWDIECFCPKCKELLKNGAIIQ
jgi:hypothetical protein